MKKLIDSNIFIDALRGHPLAISYISSHPPESLSCSAVTVAELWSGVREGCETLVATMLSKIQILSVDESIAKQAGWYMNQFKKSHNLIMADALIAATAKSIDIPLVTRNIRHFPMKDIRIEVPYKLNS